MKATKQQALEAFKTLRHFIGPVQKHVLGDNCHGEEKQWFFDKLVELAGIVSAMPKTYGQEGKGDQAIAYLHYFAGGKYDAWILERDEGRASDEPEDKDKQHQAFGFIDCGYGPELGYVSIQEIIENGGEIDLYYEPKTLAEIKEGVEARHNTKTGRQQ